MKNKTSGGVKSVELSSTAEVTAPRQQRPTDAGVLRRVPLEVIVPSPFQNRKTFKTADWAGFVESVRISGVIQPGVGRHIASKGSTDSHPTIELVCGERRFRASQELKLPDMPLIIRSLTDAEAEEIIAIENLQREGLNPLEEAQGFADWIARLMKGAGGTPAVPGGKAREDARPTCKTMKEAVAHIEQRIGKKRSVIYEALRLVKLSPAAQKALAEGKIDSSKAQLFGQVPPEQHAGLLKRVMEETYGGQTLSVNGLKKLINEEYSQQLSGAPWKWDDATLVKSAGPCSTCPKRTGNIEGLEGNPNICTDVKCFEAKQIQHSMRVLNEAKASGKRVIPAEVYERNSYEFKSQSDTCYSDSKGRSWGTLAKVAKVEPAVTVTEAGKAIEVFSPEDKAKILKANKIKSHSGGGSHQPTAAEKRKQQIKNKVDDAKIAALVAAAEGAAFTLETWRLLAAATISTCWSDTVREVIRRRSLGLKGYNKNEDLAKQAMQMTEAQCRGVMFEILVGRGMRGWCGVETYTKKAVAAFKINTAAIEKKVKAEMEKPKPAAKQKVAKKTKGLSPAQRALIAAKAKARWAKVKAKAAK